MRHLPQQVVVVFTSKREWLVTTNYNSQSHQVVAVELNRMDMSTKIIHLSSIQFEGMKMPWSALYIKSTWGKSNILP